MREIEDLRDQRFGSLVVVCKDMDNKSNRTYWICICDCGNQTSVVVDSLKRGLTTSCGCYALEKSITHGMRKSPTYNSWDNMIGRCFRQSNPEYENYGGRGITVCEKWKTFSGFLEDMGERPENKTIDRIDNNKGYTPDNCRWITNGEQQFNKRNNNIVEYNGKNIPITQAARLAGLNPATVISRQRAGLSGDALFSPAKKIFGR